MIAFIKRRWILLSCAWVLLVCSFITYAQWPSKSGFWFILNGRFHYTSDDGRTEVGVSIWLPLSIVIGWIVVRELRWREKRAKAKDSP